MWIDDVVIDGDVVKNIWIVDVWNWSAMWMMCLNVDDWKILLIFNIFYVYQIYVYWMSSQPCMLLCISGVCTRGGGGVYRYVEEV